MKFEAQLIATLVKAASKIGQLTSLYLLKKFKTLFPSAKCKRKTINIKIIFYHFKAFK